MKNSIVIALCLALSSCMSYNIQLRNTEGRIYTCKGYGFGLIGVPIAYADKDECITGAEAKGFVKQGE